MSTERPASTEPSETPEPEVLVERDDGIRIIRLHHHSQSLAYRAAFAGAYQTVFSDPPYNERFYPSEAQAVLRQHLETQQNSDTNGLSSPCQTEGRPSFVQKSRRCRTCFRALMRTPST